MRHSCIAVHAGAREGGDADGDVVGAGGAGGGVADPLAGLDVETLAGLHVEGPIGVFDVENSGQHEAIFPVVTVLSDAHPSRGRLHAGDGDLFVAGVDHTDEFVVMIGLVKRGLAVAGVIHAPVSGKFWVGELGVGAFRMTRDSEALAIVPSRVSELSRSHILVSRAERLDASTGLVQMLGAAAMRSLGSAGLKGAMVAEGLVDAYVAPRHAGKRWDACALDALVSAAGGCVTDAFGRSIDYCGETLANDQGMVVSNGALHGSILERLLRSSLP